MKTIAKPNIEDWPDVIDLEVNGVPIKIEYEKQKIMVPQEAFTRQDNISAYLIDEGFIIVE
jgi:hypothetical protein|tara:strand:- start:265 stop:447 length:183 start_codon:yes stop_codon:yes gene_type:complete